MTTKTEQAITELQKHEVSNRGHAFVILKDAGLSGSGAVFNKAVKAYEEERGVKLGKAAAAQRASDKKTCRGKAYQMSAQDVKDHINDISRADTLFWECWKLFKNERKWANKLKTAHFAIHFSR